MRQTQPEGHRRPGGRYARSASALVAAVMIVGCGAGASAPTIPTLPGHRAVAGTQGAPMTVAQSDEDMVNFARCMRTHGVQMSDPFHSSGHSGLSIDLPTQDAATASAYHACNRFIQPIVQAKEGAAPPVNPGVLTALAAYARCMRAHDIPMLDPTPQGVLNLGNVSGITGGFGRYTPQFHAADGVCRHLLPPSVHDDGTGP